MNKVTLPQAVAEAIEDLRALGFRNRDILDVISEGTGNESLRHTVAAIADYANDQFDDLLHALVAGYTVERTPEEEIRSYFEGLEERVDDYSDGLHDGIKYVLDQLDIKIEGVNA
jgi:hypothetical protein